MVLPITLVEGLGSGTGQRELGKRSERLWRKPSGGEYVEEELDDDLLPVEARLTAIEKLLADLMVEQYRQRSDPLAALDAYSDRLVQASARMQQEVAEEVRQAMPEAPRDEIASVAANRVISIHAALRQILTRVRGRLSEPQEN